MKTAFLILAHHQPAHVARLAYALRRDWNHVFIHVDRKVDGAPFQQATPETDGITFVAENRRIPVTWGGFSMVRATLELLRTARRSGTQFSRFCLLSGSDFPIKPMAQIRQRFDSDDELIRVDRHLDDTDDRRFRDRIRFLYFTELPEKAEQSGVTPREPYRKIPPYHGSQWWSLTADCMDYVLAFIAENPDFVEFHRWSWIPDEIFFHSIVKSSPFSSRITHDFENADSLEDFMASHDHGPTYVDWSDETGPMVLTADDDLKLEQSDCLFARKLDESKSAGLIALLEQRVG